MTVKEVVKDPKALTLTCVGEFAAPVARVWRVWSEPELLGKWWGPPEWPSTFVSYELAVGGRAHYFMQGPNGDRHHGGWVFTAIDPRRSLSFEDYFADESGTPNRDLPGTACTVTFTESEGRTTMTMTSRFVSIEQMEEFVKMGMVEGIRAAMGQIDTLL